MKVVYPGSFDPPTNGHLDIILRCSKIFDKVIIAILNNYNKNTIFNIIERQQMLEQLTKNIHNVNVKSFTGLLVDFCEDEGAKVIVRGLRGADDLEYEMKMAFANKNINHKLETIFIPSDAKNTWISSSLVKEIVTLNGDYSTMVPELVKHSIERKFGGENNE